MRTHDLIDFKPCSNALNRFVIRICYNDNKEIE